MRARHAGPHGLLGLELVLEVGLGFRELALVAGGAETASVRWEGSLPARARGEILEEVWTLEGRGLRPFRAAAGRAGSAVPDVLYAGSVAAGLVQSRRGHAYQVGWGRWKEGIHTEVIHASDRRVVELRGPAVGLRAPLTQVATVAPRVPEPEDVPALLLLLGFLRLARSRCPWLSFTTLGVDTPTVEGAMEALIREMA